MTFSPKQKKWVKRILWLIGIRLVVGVIIYLIVTYHFKELMAVLVKKESHGKYAFTAASINVKMFREELHIQDARIYCADSSNESIYWNVHIPEMELQLNSLLQLVFHKILTIDSADIKGLTVKVAHAHRNKIVHTTQHWQQVMEKFVHARQHFKVQRLSLDDAALYYDHPAVNKRIGVLGLQLILKNNKDISASLPPQNWYFPELGKHLQFEKLQVSNRYLSIRNPKILGHADSSEVIFAADHVFSTNFYVQPDTTQLTLGADTLFVRSSGYSSLPTLNYAWKAFDSIRYGVVVRHFVVAP